MAFRWNGSSNYLAVTTAMPSNAWTMCGWIRPNVLSGSVDFYLGAGNTSAIGLGVGLSQAGPPARWGIVDGGTVFTDFPTFPPITDWWFLALQHNGAQLRGWQRHYTWRSLQQVFQARTTTTLTSMRFGNSTFDATDFADGRMAGCRIWSRLLSTNELLKESFQLQPLNRARLHTYAQEDTRVNLSGRFAALTLTGSLVREPGPNIPKAVPQQLWDRLQAASTTFTATLTAAVFTFTPQNLTWLAKYLATLTAAVFTFTPQTLVANAKYFAQLTAAQFKFNPQPMTWLAKYLAQLTAAVFTFTPQSPTWLAKYVANLTAPVFQFVGKDVTVTSTTTFIATLTAAVFGITPQNLTWLAAFLAQLTAPAFQFVPQPVSWFAKFMVQLTAAVFTFTGQALIWTVSGVAARVYRGALWIAVRLGI